MAATDVVGALFLLGAAAASLYGWGALVMRASARPARPSGLVVGVGLAAVLFVGGVLNLARLAFPAALDVVAIAGLLLALVHRPRGPAPWVGCTTLPVIAPAAAWLGFLALAVLLVISQVSPAAFNSGDDFRTYFTHPVRMLETGTLYPHALSILGRSTLGGQAFLQGFALGHFPIPAINAVDAVFAALLCAAMPLSFVAGRRGGAAFGLLAVLGIAVISPQYVNVSALYTASSLYMVLLLLDASAGGPPAAGTVRAEIPVALVYAALVVLKLTCAVFVVAHVLLRAAAGSLATRGVRDPVRRVGVTAAWGAVFLAPWLLLYAPLYSGAWGGGGARRAPVLLTPPEALNPLDRTPLFYGDSVLAYSAIVLSMAFVGTGFVYGGLRSRDGAVRARSLGVGGTLFTGVAVYLVTLRWLSVWLGAPQDTLRYVVPVLLGLAGASWVLGADMLPGLIGGAIGRWTRPVILLLAFACFAPFVPGAVARYRQAREHGSMLAFKELATNENYKAYNRFVLSEASSSQIDALQAMVPPARPLLAWVAYPFLLDFSRNPVVDVDMGGLTNRWARMPRVEYVLWDYRGYRMPDESGCRGMSHGPNVIAADMGLACLELLSRLDYLARDAQILFNDGATILFRIAPSEMKSGLPEP